MSIGSIEHLAAESEARRIGALHVWWPRAVVVAALILTLILRLVGIGSFVVEDEDDLALEANAYYGAVVSGDWAATVRAKQPAVISRWIGATASALLSQREYGELCDSLTIRPDDMPASCTLDELTMLTALHTGMALFTWLLLGLCALWLWRLYRPEQAALMVAFLSFDPFLLGHSRLANGEGLLAYLLLASCLSLAVALQQQRKGFFIVSAILGGLALAEKLVGAYGLIVAAALLGYDLWRQGERGWAWTRRWLGKTLLWAVLALITIFAIWPAMWVTPLEAVRQLQQNLWTLITTLEIASEHYLLGGTLTANATPLLYALTLLFRLTPITLIGFVVALAWADRDAKARREVVPWLLFGLGFVLLLAVGIRQGPNNILTTFAAFDIAAALAFCWLAERWAAKHQRDATHASGLAVGALAVISLLYLLPTMPYYLTSYNWLLGGAPVAVHAIDVGIGEGLDQAAAYLRDLPGGEELEISSGFRDSFRPFFPGRSYILDYNSVYQSDYAVFYVNQWQKRTNWELWIEYQQREPVYEVRMQGIPYARIYKIDRPTEAVAYLEGLAQADELVVAEIDTLFSRDYRGAAELWLPSGAEPMQIRDELVQLIDGYDTIWWVIYPESRGNYDAMVREVMMRFTETVGEQRFTDLRIEQHTVRHDWIAAARE